MALPFQMLVVPVLREQLETEAKPSGSGDISAREKLFLCSKTAISGGKRKRMPGHKSGD